MDTETEVCSRNRPLIVAGPCSAENPQQLRAVVEGLLCEERVKMIRVGVWKPRTHPGGFEGFGERALEWMEELNKEHEGRICFCCEVASAAHVEACLRHCIGQVWIGARTVVNPFVVNEISRALEGTGMGVMVKNPMHPDVDLWEGAIERMEKVGIADIKAIHRGFSTFKERTYRNNPLWEIPMELKRRRPTIPLLCDPSHISGRRELVESVAQQALNLQYDGLFIETHCCPEQALTDCEQQITPEELRKVLDRLVIRNNQSTSSQQLLVLRERIDQIDDELIDLLRSRMAISKEIGILKKQENIPIFQPLRWEEVLRRQMERGERYGLNKDFVKEFMEAIHAESVRLQ